MDPNPALRVAPLNRLMASYRRQQARQGLIQNHAYSVLSAFELPSEPEAGVSDVKVVRVRNPWGGVPDWSGALCEGSEAWM